MSLLLPINIGIKQDLFEAMTHWALLQSLESVPGLWTY